MELATPETMRAVAADTFGGLDKLLVKTLPVPHAGPEEILVRVEAAGVGVWDPFEVEGGFASMFGRKPKFPYVPGSDGAGTVVEVGTKVTRFKKGDRVWGISDFNGNGFHAEYALIKARHAWPLPANLPIDQAGAMPVDAMTALQGLEDALRLKEGETLLIFGASGGVGHLAVQLARRIGARVFAVASGDDGVALAQRLGADVVVEGHRDDVLSAARQFSPAGLDAALLTAGGAAAERALQAVRRGGRVAYPHGIEPEPKERAGLTITAYDCNPNEHAMERLNRLIEAGPFEVHIARSFPLERIGDAERGLDRHYIGKLGVIPTV